MAKIKKPIKRSILVGTIIFIVLLCLVLSIVQYATYRKLLYGRYEKFIEGVLNYAAADIDIDDLAQCIKSGEESDKYRQLQGELDAIKERLDIHFIYVIVPINTEPNNNVKNVIAGATQYEYEHEADELVKLNSKSGSAYTSEAAKKYMAAYQTGELAFFNSVTQWGDDYTGMLPLSDAKGNRVAALCVDVNIADIQTTLRNGIILTVSLIAGLGLVFIILLWFWMSKNVTAPLAQMGKSVEEFAAKCRDQKDPELLTTDEMNVRSENEVGRLSEAVERMGGAAREYVQSIKQNEKELSKMIVAANKDELTSVRNTTAFEAYKIDLDSRMHTGGSQCAVLMIDVNDVQKVNKLHGEEKGDLYIVNNCRRICEVFDHSPVFRFGGDEFVVVLQGKDYEEREALISGLRQTVEEMAADASIPAWERCAVAIGIAEYNPEMDDSVDEVLRRADQDMQREKERLVRGK